MRTLRNPWFVVVPVAVAGSLVAAVGAGILCLYVLGNDSAPVRLLAAAIPFPAATVDGVSIRWSRWNDLTRAFVALAEQGKTSISGAASRHDIGRNVLDRLVRNAVLERVAERRGIVVADAEADAEYRRVAKDQDDRQTLDALLRELGWSDADVKREIIRPYLIGRRLSERLGSVAAAEKEVDQAMADAPVKVYVRF